MTFQHAGAEYVLGHLRKRKTHLLGMVTNRLFFDIRIVNDRVQVVLCQETRIRRNPNYKGTLILEGDWAGDWHLTPT